LIDPTISRALFFLLLIGAQTTCTALLPDNEISWEPAAAPVRPLERQMSQMTHGSHASVSAVSTMGGGS